MEFQAVGLEGERLPAEIETTLYRAVQEALANTAEYAGTRNVSVIVGRRGSEAVAMVEDDGTGFDPDAPVTSAPGRPGGLGLAGMRERVGLLGGAVQIEAGASRSSPASRSRRALDRVTAHSKRASLRGLTHAASKSGLSRHWFLRFGGGCEQVGADGAHAVDPVANGPHLRALGGHGSNCGSGCAARLFGVEPCPSALVDDGGHAVVERLDESLAVTVKTATVSIGSSGDAHRSHAPA